MTDSPNTTLLSRRALMSVSVGLVGANVAAAAIAVRAAQAIAPAAADTSTDAELFDAWEQVLAAQRECHATRRSWQRAVP